MISWGYRKCVKRGRKRERVRESERGGGGGGGGTERGGEEDRLASYNLLKGPSFVLPVLSLTFVTAQPQRMAFITFADWKESHNLKNLFFYYFFFASFRTNLINRVCDQSCRM